MRTYAVDLEGPGGQRDTVYHTARTETEVEAWVAVTYPYPESEWEALCIRSVDRQDG